jgi:hypothetical protein
MSDGLSERVPASDRLYVIKTNAGDEYLEKIETSYRMKGGVPIIGGKADGQFCPMRLPRMKVNDETYMGCTFRDEQGEHYFYQLAGMAPADVLKIFRERQKVAKGISGKA